MSYRRRGRRSYGQRPRGKLKATLLGTHGKRGQYVDQWLVQSRSDPSKSYKVSQTRSGEYQCSCPHWKFRRRECKHIRKVKSQIQITATTPITPQEFVEGRAGRRRKVVEVHNTLI